MISYELFEAIDNYMYKDGELTDKQLKDYIRECGKLNFNFAYSRGGRNYIVIDTEVIGKVSVCKKNANTFRRIIALAIRLAKLDYVNKQSIETWVKYLSNCNNMIYKKIQ